MSDFLLNTLSQVNSLLFSASDTLNLGETLQNADISISTSGTTVVLASHANAWSFDQDAFSSASQAGQISFEDGTHLIVGGDDVDHLLGTSGNDIIWALGGHDWVGTNGGNDVVYGGNGNDTIEGGAGNEHLYGNVASGGADGADKISAGDGMDYVQGNAGNDTLDGGAGADRINGGADEDLITGGAGNDSINGNFGADTIDGGAGNDALRGGKGDDIVQGGDGNDTLTGDLGGDTLTGGAGHDTFVFKGSDAAVLSTDFLTGHVDTITDFTHGEDHIALGFTPHAVDQFGALTLVDALTSAIAALTGHGSDVAETTIGGDTYLFYSSSNGAIADSVIKLDGVHSLDLHDFV